MTGKMPSRMASFGYEFCRLGRWSLAFPGLVLFTFSAFSPLEANANEKDGVAVLLSKFQNPPDDARIMMRWWWFGPAVTKPEIKRELEAMKAAGIGGVEIQSTYPVALDNPAAGIQNLPFLSPGFLDALKYANEQAQALGLRVDLTLGSGWPFGGPSIPIEQAAACLRVERVKLTGSELDVPVPRTDKGESLLGVFLARRDGDRIDAEGTHELTAIKSDRVQLPINRNGANEVIFFFSSRTKQQVKRPSVGAEGLVLDHYDRGAVDHYLDSVAKPLLQAFGAKPPHAIFCDSLEVYGADWTPEFLQEFQKRRGYDLKPLLPALVSDFGPNTAEVRRDWGATLTELFAEHFVQPVRKWAHEHGTLFRLQGYGTPPAALSTSRFSDLPEGEGAQWDAMSASRWASSASHIFDRSVTSSETWTWVNSPSFRATPLDLKAEADLHFLQGINQLIGHGWPYSGPQTDYPGWRLYASGALNDKNPWWIVMPELTKYLQRVSFLLRQGLPANDVAIYLPNDDAWAQFKDKQASLFEILRDRTSAVVSETLKAGYTPELFDGSALNEVGVIDSGSLALGPNKYKIVILPGVERIAPETLRKFEEFVKQGGVLIATGRLPDKAPGVRTDDVKTQEVSRLARELFDGASPTASFVPDVKSGLADKLRSKLPPDVSFSGEGKGLGFVHRRTPDADLYFVANTRSVPADVKATFRVEGSSGQSWDPFTGRATPLTSIPGEGGEKTISLSFEPYQSRIIVFSKEGEPGPTATAISTGTIDQAPIDLSTGWRVSFDKKAPLTMDKLRSWTDDEATRFYSGLATYEKEVSVPQGYLQSGLRVKLDLGPYKSLPPMRMKNGTRTWIEAPVQEAAVVYMNGRSAGGIWRPPYEVDVTELLRAGTNQLKIVVGNTAINSLAGQPAPDYKALNQRFGERFKPQDMDNLKPIASGLTGPIRLYRSPASR